MADPIQVFEWESLRIGEQGFSDKHHAALHQWQDQQLDNYFQVHRRSIKFTQWVGVIQVGSLIVEVLPKADKSRNASNADERRNAVKRWKSILIEMLRKAGRLKVRASDNTDLSVRHQSLFDLYFQNYLEEVEQLIHRGLVKKYRREERNRLALKGKLLLQKQVTCNAIHKERFYSQSSEYDRQNDWNEILLAALRVAGREAQGGLLQAKAKNLSLHFPDWPVRLFSSHTFDRLHYDRKTEGYQRAIALAKLILLQLNPQIASGKERVVAILFDMNRLWEEWLLATYRFSYRNDDRVTVLGKKRKTFWRSDGTGTKEIESDILVQVKEAQQTRMMVLDAKWKQPGLHPADDELKQMFAYNLMWESQEAWLVYPQVDGEHDRKGRLEYKDAGLAGMAFVDVFEGARLRKELTLPSGASAGTAVETAYG